MANYCDNTFYFQSNDKENIEYVWNFINEHFEHWLEKNETLIEGGFGSKWIFPEELMFEMYENLPNKDDVYARCLSVEFGCLYHAMWICDENGWQEV